MLKKPVVKGSVTKPVLTAVVTLKKPVVKGAVRKPVKS